MTLYLDHFGLNQPPYRITPSTDRFFSGANRGPTLEALRYAIQSGEGLIKVVGEVGSGKTMMSRMLIENLPANIHTVYIATPSISQDEVFHAIASELGIGDTAAHPGQLLRDLQSYLIKRYEEGHQVVVIIDEAHVVPPETLERIRLLSNLEAGHHKLLQIVLFGQPELNEVLATHALRPLRERITHSIELAPFDEPTVGAYLDFRLRAAGYRGPELFSREAIREIASASCGLTRRINILADKALLSAFADGRHGIEKADAQRASQDCGYQNILAAIKTGNGESRHRPWWWLGGGLVVVLLAVLLMLRTQTGAREAEALGQAVVKPAPSSDSLPNPVPPAVKPVANAAVDTSKVIAPKKVPAVATKSASKTKENNGDRAAELQRPSAVQSHTVATVNAANQDVSTSNVETTKISPKITNKNNIDYP